MKILIVRDLKEIKVYSTTYHVGVKSYCLPDLQGFCLPVVSTE